MHAYWCAATQPDPSYMYTCRAVFWWLLDCIPPSICQIWIIALSMNAFELERKDLSPQISITFVLWKNRIWFFNREDHNFCQILGEFLQFVKTGGTNLIISLESQLSVGCQNVNWIISKEIRLQCRSCYCFELKILMKEPKSLASIELIWQIPNNFIGNPPELLIY